MALGLLCSMVMENIKSHFVVFLVMGFLTVGCAPGFETAHFGSEQALSLASLPERDTLSASSTGQETLEEITLLEQDGYVIKYIEATAEKISQLGGHDGVAFVIKGKVVSIYLDQSLSVPDRAHAIVHALMHVKDEVESEKFLRSYPVIAKAIKTFLAKIKVKELDWVDQLASYYVRVTTLCTEIRAFSRNQKLSSEGLVTSRFEKGEKLLKYIDDNMIVKFGSKFGASVDTMAKWCEKLPSITEVQKHLVW
jgi:hypothetical protein